MIAFQNSFYTLKVQWFSWGQRTHSDSFDWLHRSLKIKQYQCGWGGYSRWHFKSRLIFIPKFVEKWDPFLFQRHKFYANFTENFTLFSKIVKLSSKFCKFLYQFDEIGPISMQILENFENMTHIYTSFCTEKGTLLYQEPDLRPISTVPPRIDLCTKIPLPTVAKGTLQLL